MHGLAHEFTGSESVMIDLTIVTITSDPKFLALVRHQLHDQVAPGSRIVVARTVAEACVLLAPVRPRLIVLHWTRESRRYEQLAQLLWATSVHMRKIPVLVIADRYRTDQATMMYRMGVSDYISRTHHIDQLGDVFSAYFPHGHSAGVRAADDLSARAAKAWSTSSDEPQSVANRAV
jgi:response regulator of citrate/malate metabolism